MNDARAILLEIPKTERSPVGMSLAVAGQDNAPKGLGCAGYEPLMKNLKGHVRPAPIGIIASDTFSKNGI